MTPPVRVSLGGPAVGKGRPRATRTGRVYTPAPTRRYETELKGEAQRAMAGRPLLEGPVAVTVSITFAVPASWPAWKRESALAGKLVPTVKPDFDNLVKVCDAFKGVVWRDDAQVVDAKISKIYGEKPGLIAVVDPLPLLSAQSKSPPSH